MKNSTMKIMLVVALFAGFALVMGTYGCGGGGLIGGEDQTATEEETEGTQQEELLSSMDMPGLTVMSDKDADPSQLCLMNYVPEEAYNFVGSALSDSTLRLLDILGIDDLDNDEAQELIGNIDSNVKELVALVSDEGDYGILARIQDGLSMDDFLNNFFLPLLDQFNEARDQEEGDYAYQVLDNETIIMSLTQEIIDQVALKVQNGSIAVECSFYRTDPSISSRPAIYLIAKGKTALLDNLSAEEPLASMVGDIRNSMGILSVDFVDGVIRFDIAAVDSTDVDAANVIAHLSLKLDTNNPLIGLLLDAAVGSLMEGGDDDGGQVVQ